MDQRIKKLCRFQSREEVNKKLEEINSYSRLITEEFYGMRDKLIFKDIGLNIEFTSDIEHVLLGVSCKERAKIKRQQTMLEKYGCHFSKTNEFRTKVKKTMLERYGVEHNMKHPELSLKNARSNNKKQIKIHWKNLKELVCVGTYEAAVVDYLNFHKIDYIWQPEIFNLKNTTYRPDLYLIEKDLYIEIKGFFRQDALDKWNKFQEIKPNSELWDKQKLKELGFKFNRKGKASYG